MQEVEAVLRNVDSTVNSQLVHMVRILSFHLEEPGSIPGLGIINFKLAWIAQLVRAFDC